MNAVCLEQSRCPTYLLGANPRRRSKAGILLGEDLAFQAKEAGSNPTTRSKLK